MSQYCKEMSLKEIFEEMEKVREELYKSYQENIEKSKTREQLIDERLDEMDRNGEVL